MPPKNKLNIATARPPIKSRIAPPFNALELDIPSLKVSLLEA